MKKFRDRRAAGQHLARRLESLKVRDVIVLALPRGGVPVAFEIAQHLHVPLEVLLVRKLGVPGHEELAMGAVASGGICVLNHDIIQELAITQTALDHEIAKETAELQRREKVYRGDKVFPGLENKTVIVVDDGIATGATMHAAVAALKQHKSKRIIVAVPTSARDTLFQLQREADEVVCLAVPEPYGAVGLWYDNFPQITDEEVESLLKKSSGFVA
jgi:putative phosphoribosyl transferase